MAITLKKKTDTNPPEKAVLAVAILKDQLPSGPVLTEAQQEALEAVGLAPSKTKITIKKLPRVVQDSRVRITNSLFPWVRYYKPGDCGTVIRCLGIPSGGYSEQRDALFVIALDTPRYEGRGEVILALWEIELMDDA